MKTGEGKLPTLKTVAGLTGLSQSTVSLCLRGGGGVKQSTREKIERVAREIGYVPNRAGVRLRTGKTNVLSLVLSASRDTLDFTRQLIQGIGAEIDGTRFHLNVIPEFARSESVGAVRYILRNRSADGVILTHTSARDPRVQILMDADFPFVCHGRTEFYTPHPYHDFDAAKFVEIAVARLAARGRRRILLAVADNGTTNYATILAGFMRAAAQTGSTGEIVRDSAAIGTAGNARRYGRSLAGRPEPFDAIVSNNELTALAIVGGLQSKGVRLGEDYDFICKQTTEILPTLHPGMDTVKEDLLATGRELVSLLIRRVEGEAPERLQTLHAPRPSWKNGS